MERTVDKEKAAKLANKVKSGKGFDLEDFREQLAQMRNMGGMMGMLDKLPGMSGLPDNVKDQMDDKLTVRMEAIISSMTPKERAHPDLIKGSRKRRIAAGSGMQVQDVNKLLKQFTEMQRMMKKMSGKGGMRKMMQEIVKAEAQKEIVDVFKTFILNAYGEKSDDGRKHKKTQELRDDFASTAAYAAFYMQLAEDASLAARFINGVVPKGMAQELAKEI